MNSSRIKSEGEEEEEEIDELEDDNNEILEVVRLNHLEYCLKVLETDQMTVVEPPLIRYKDLEINLDPDPTKFMTFPMTFSPHIKSELAIVFKQHQNRNKLDQQPTPTLTPTPVPVPVPEPSSQKGRGIIHWTEADTLHLIKLCVMRPALNFTEITLRINNGKSESSARSKWTAIKRPDSSWSEVVIQAWKDESKRLLGEVVLLDTS